MRKTFLVTIDTDNDIADKYPNFHWNYGNAEEFIEARVQDIIAIAGDGSFGYDIFVEEVDDA